MKPDDSRQVDCVLLGSYPLEDAKRLLERLEQAGIAFHTRPRSPFPQPGPPVTMDVSVELARSSEVAQIQRELFGDGLPNYDSSFFREHRNV
jgi:extradiol dioxygenase family protein